LLKSQETAQLWSKSKWHVFMVHRVETVHHVILDTKTHGMR